MLPLVFVMGFAILQFGVVVHSQGPPPGAPASIKVQFIIRDFVGNYPNGAPPGFNKTTHRDFQRISAFEPGIVNRVLGADRVRIRSSLSVSLTKVALY